MRKGLLKSVVVAALLFWSTCAVMAETKVYGYMSAALNYEMASFDLDAVGGDDAVVPVTVQDMPGVKEVKSGVSVGDRYYAFYTDDDSNNCFGTFNFETGEVVRVKNYGKSNDPDIKGLAYDAGAGVLYGLNYPKLYDDDGYMIKSGQLVKIGLTDGSLDVVKTYEADVVYDVLIGDGNGGIYWISNENKKDQWYILPRLFKVDVANDYDRELLVDNTDIAGGWGNYNNSGIVRDGKVVYIANATVFEFDITAKTITNIGTMKKFVGGLTYTKSAESAEPGPDDPVKRLLVRTTWFGDAMGMVGNDVDMSKKEYFYGPDLKLLREIESGRKYDESQKPLDYDLKAITKYHYDDNGNLDSTARYQYGQYDFGDMALRLRTTAKFEYNDKGQLIKEPSDGYILNYEYDEDGNRVKMTKTSLTSGDTIQVLEYDDFIGPDKPQFVISDSPLHPEWTGYIYKAIIGYDENLNKVSELRVTYDWKSIQEEVWTYDETFLKEYIKYGSFSEETGEPIPSLKTVYWLLDNDPNKVMHADSTYYDGEWYGSNRPCLDEYIDFTDMDEATATELIAEASADTLNTVKLTFSMPQIIYMTGNGDFNIYRNGQLIAKKNVFELFNEETYKLEYKDSMLYNNDYEYFVQTVASGSAIAPFDLDDDEEMPAPEPVAYCISNIAEVSLHIDLPAVTDLKYGGQRQDENNDTRVTVSWTNPEYPENYEFLSNELYFRNYQLADTVTTDAKATGLEGRFYGSSDVFVLTRYKYGKAISDTITVTLVPVGIDAVTTGSGAAISFNGKELLLSENADVQVYSMSGRLEMKAANTGRMSLDNLSSGAYIICVSRNGKTSAHKVVLK